MKKPLSLILGIILMLTPTVAATILYFLPNISIMSPENELGGTLSVSNTEAYFFNEKENAFLNSYFNELEENSKIHDISKDDISFEKKFSISIRSESAERNLDLFLSLNGDCYWSDGNGVYIIDSAYSDSFINSQYARALYKNSSMPLLTTDSKYTVFPSRSQWNYTLKNGSLAGGLCPPNTSETTTYYSSGITGFNFSLQPDECSVKAYVDGIKVYDGSLEGLSSSELENESFVKYEIYARWSSGRDAFGEAEYSFCIRQLKSAVFSIDKHELTQGDFITVSAENIADLSELSCSLPDVMAFDPIFVKSGNNAYALIPFRYDLPVGSYELTFSYKDTSVSFEIDLLERAEKEQSDDSDIYKKLTDRALSDMHSLISSTGKSFSDTSYVHSTFYNYEQDFTIRLGFGNKRIFSDGTTFKLDGVDFYCPSGENIPAFNNGIVCAVGEDALLGKYVAIEHGYGLKSWYCHLGEITVSVGNSVIKGDTVARSGMSGMASTSGFYLMTTVFDVPVCPYAIYESNFILPK